MGMLPEETFLSFYQNLHLVLICPPLKSALPKRFSLKSYFAVGGCLNNWGIPNQTDGWV